MANLLYPIAKKKILDQDTGMDFLADTIKASLMDSADYTYSAAHDFYDDISAGVEETATLASKSTTAGAFDSADPTFTAATGDQCEYVALWSDTGGAASTDPLIALFDTFASGMPVILNGGDVVLNVHANGWLSL